MAFASCRLSRSALLAVFTVLTTLLCTVWLPSVGHADELPIPNLAKWESQMVKYAKTHCTSLTSASGDSALASTYYDMTRVMYQIADYTNDPSWIACAQRAKYIYRDTYVTPNKGGIPGYWNFTTGLRTDFLESGDSLSQQAAILLSQRAAYAPDTTPAEWTVSASKSREVAYAIVSYIDAEMLGQPRRARRAILVDQAYGHLNQWFVKFAWQGSGAPLTQFSPFMVGLTAHGLIRDWEQTHDPRLIPALRMAADWLWANAWLPAERAMFYDARNGGTGPGSGAPDLNLLIAPMYAFLYAETGETKYRDQGDAIFSGGVDRAWLNNAKQFNQNYWWSFDYVLWRSGGSTPPPTTPPPPPADRTPPSIAITAPAAGATISGQLAVGVTMTDNVAVASLKYYVDNVAVAVQSPPTGKYTWDTTTSANGTHTLQVVAADAAGNSSKASVSVTVANAARTSTSISAPAIVSNASAVIGVAVSGGATTAQGSVNLSIDKATTLTASLVNGRAQFTVPGLAVGDHALLATYVPQGAFSPSSASATLRVNPTSGTVAFSSSKYSAVPVSYKTAVTIVRSAPAESTVSVRYATSDGTARAGVDYVAGSGTVNFGPGVTQQTVLVEILKSTTSSPKTLSLALSNPTGGAVISAPSTATLTVDAASASAGLVAAYSFDETSGSTIVDLSGNNNTGSLQGATRTAQGRFGAALSFDGTSSRVVIANSASLALTSAMTLEAWVYPTSNTARWQDIIFKDIDAYYLESHSPRNAPGAGGTFVTTPVYGKSPIPVNAWTHLATTYDQQMLRLYVNGVEVASQPRTLPIAVSTRPLYLGGDPTFGQHFKGLIDQVRIYNRALSPAEIQQNMNQPL